MADAAKLADQASKALNTQDYPTAISLYTSAISILPTAVDYYIKRSTAYQRSGQYEPAVADAETAVVLAHQRGKRELIGQAQLRRGISCYLLSRYGDAGFCFSTAKKLLGDKERSVDIWQSKLDLVMKDTEKVPEDDMRREVTIKEVPDVAVPKAGGAEKKAAEVGDGAERKIEEKQQTAPRPPSPKGVITPRDKIRNEWYQTPTHVVFTLYVKGVPKDSATIEIESQSISISFPLGSGSDFNYDLDPLFASVDPNTSTFAILSTKIELKLTKSTPGQKWPSLEGIPESKGKARASEPTTTTTKTTSSPPATSAYPTSSKSGPKNWDKVAAELSGDPNAPGGADDDEEGDPVNHFFKKLYKDADPDTRRAMMKSYLESNGTALSTNWADVGKKKVETSPPEGLVAKKWDE